LTSALKPFAATLPATLVRRQDVSGLASLVSQYANCTAFAHRFRNPQYVPSLLTLRHFATFAGALSPESEFEALTLACPAEAVANFTF
jgi:hypothetical protein